MDTVTFVPVATPAVNVSPASVAVTLPVTEPLFAGASVKLPAQVMVEASSSVTVTSMVELDAPLYPVSELAGSRVRVTRSSAVSASCSQVTVTVCAWFQVVVLKLSRTPLVMVVAPVAVLDTVAAPVSSEVTSTVTVAVGRCCKRTVNVSLPPSVSVTTPRSRISPDPAMTLPSTLRVEEVATALIVRSAMAVPAETVVMVAPLSLRVSAGMLIPSVSMSSACTV